MDCDTPRTAAAYIRVSTEDQAEFSPDSQLLEIRRYAALHNIVIPDEYIFIDEGVSGKTARHRPAFNRMIGTAKIKPKPFDLILLWKFSRFARSREDSIVYKSMLRRELGIDVLSISEPVGGDKMSVLFEAMIEAMDEYYSINLAEEVRRGMTQRAREGRHNTYAPFGYYIENGCYMPDGANAKVVCKIFSDFADGKQIADLVRELDALGVKSRFGNPLSRRALTYMLSNPVYAGQMRWNTAAGAAVLTRGVHQPLIDRALFERTQQRLARLRAQYPSHARQDGSAYLCKGLVKCSHCGATLTRAGRGLQCSRYSAGQCPISHYISLKRLDQAVCERLRCDLGDLSVPLPPSKPPASPSALPDALLARERAKLDRLRASYESGADSLEEYRASKARVLDRIHRLEAQKSAAEPSAASEGQELSDGVSLEEKNRILRSFVSKIVFDRPGRRLTIFYRGQDTPN